MTKTMTATEVENEVTPVTDTELTETAASLIENCSEVQVRVSGFSTSAKMDEETAHKMLKETGADRRAVSISKRLLSGKHQALLAFRQARKAIDDHVAAWTVPMLALRAVQTDNGAGLMRKDAGVRLIQKKDIAEFDERLQYLIGIFATATEQLQKALPEIKAEDKARLGKAYRETDYVADITELVGVGVTYRPVGIDIDWKELCPAVYEREQIAARQKFEAVVENAAVEFATRFVKYVKQVCDQLGNRTRLNPLKTQNKLDLLFPDAGDGTVKATLVAEAEVLTVLKHEDEPDEIPEGHLLLELRLPKEGKGRSADVWTAAPLKEAYYWDVLRPYESEQRRKLYDSTIDNLKSELEAFLNIGDLLGPYKGAIENGVTQVKAMLRKGAENLDTSKITEQLREGSYFRNEMKTALEGVVGMVQTQMTEATSLRRKIRKELIGKV